LEVLVFYRARQLQYAAQTRSARTDYSHARLQEILGGPVGRISPMYDSRNLTQGWNCRGPAKYRDHQLDTGTEEMAHVEMVSTD
jgi:Mn-containing catalase